ncbi:hypothetical protein FDP41_002034 [Naegleria fowleri]|uniref:NADH dehydrogenase [ubiquinone] 1 beta subcomplex subunit 7 n=1 Tax=Naegleria fowleri TaxID=5763 RepID=A0A6A5BXC1_NAEFO|nr:uncharacterized protein FDP41_002034 [Naegleria fowleri]KAF0978964.1 hypothetical protein FDP41_002034 [Naegleria fowleri]CAG4709711.1 unnamed protein product [Naegleria fowleri]
MQLHSILFHSDRWKEFVPAEMHEEVEAKVKKLRPLVSEDEMDKHEVPLYLRDACVHRVIPLNQCRHENFYNPFKCNEERVRYERCQYKRYLRWVQKSQELWRREEKLRIIKEKLEKAKKNAPAEE